MSIRQIIGACSVRTEIMNVQHPKLHLKNPRNLIFSAGIVLYTVLLIYVIQNPGILLTRDSHEYLNAAENLQKTGIFYCGELNEPPEPSLYSRRTPVYPLVILIAELIWKNHFSILILQFALLILNIYLLIRISGRLQIKTGWQNVILLIYLFYPSQIIYTFMIMSEILFQSLLLISLASFLEFFYTRRLRYLVYFNIILSIALLTKPVLLYFWIPNALFHFWLAWKYRKVAILLLPALMILTVVSWSLRNYKVTGYYHFSSIKNFNLLYYNTYPFLLNKYGQETADSFIYKLETENRGASFAQENRNIENACFTVIFGNPVSYAIFHLRGSLLFFIDPGRYDIYQFLQLDGQTGFLAYLNRYGFKGAFILVREIPFTVIIYLMTMAGLNLILSISLLIFIVSPRIEPLIKFLVLLIILYIAGVTGPVGASRHRIPVFPLLALTIPFSAGMLPHFQRTLHRE